MLFTMKMTDSELENLSYGFAEWYAEEYGDCEKESNNPIIYNEYAEYLMNEVTTDDDELMTTMYAVVQYYGEEGYVFQDWYEARTIGYKCDEYEEWKHAQPSADEFICSEEAKCTNDDNCKGCYGTDDETEPKTKISNWLNDKNNNENDLIDFLVEECGVVIKEQKE